MQPLPVVDGRQGGEVDGDVGMRPAERRLHDRDGALVARLRLGVDSLFGIERRDRGEMGRQIEMVGAERGLDDLGRLPVEDLGFRVALFRHADFREVVQGHGPPQVVRGEGRRVVGGHQQQLLGLAVAAVLAGVEGGLHVVLPLQSAAGRRGDVDDEQDENEDSRPEAPWLRAGDRVVEHPTGIIGSRADGVVERTGR